ncbi:hypothetical protein HX021_15120 [Sphingobacterium sp. N143]|uniref:hypothetical protein n=1 Tax=Sphingobacterium sp. N143 TaxID=2746727 RepID=UPI002574945A|nr:hypothetical protein [Sphingobacterium sp. N143]MDM1295621.1 hypothetical protein [Sphingobacterium sp. N143]
MKYYRITGMTAALALLVGAIGCNNSSTKSTDQTDSTGGMDTTAAQTMDSISVTPIADSKQFPGADLQIASITAEKAGTDSAKVTVKYDVKNFKLTEMTDDEHATHMANSHDGQHIHFILDNKPYTALYKPENSVMVPLNSEHYLLSFLSRSYHESIKTTEASKLVKFKIDAAGKLTLDAAPKEPSLFYSRPKGEYKGEETKNLLLDFYLVNTNIASDGNKVIADINGQTFTLDKWGPYEIKGLPMGNNKVKLTLIDKDGNAVTGDNVSVERDIKLSEK